MSIPRKKSVTAKDIARVCGISQATVSYVMNNKEGKLDGTVSAEIYAVVDTNVTTGCEVSISGTALTLMENTATPDYSDSNYIALTITAQTGAEGSPLVYNAETPATEEPIVLSQSIFPSADLSLIATSIFALIRSPARNEISEAPTMRGTYV